MTHQRPCVVMIPGTLCDGRVFARQQRQLRGLADIRCIDLHGMQPGRKHEGVTAWVRQLLRTLPEKFSLVGFSLGGICALEILRSAPERVERLAMVASNAQAASRKGQRNSRRLGKLWKRHDAGAGAIVQGNLPRYFHHPRDRRRHASLILDMARRTPTPAALAQFSWAGSRPEGLSVLSDFKGPVLLVSGAKDRLCPRPWQQAMARACPHARWLDLERTGHFVSLEASSALSESLKQWLDA